jgi:hypothetical protein
MEGSLVAYKVFTNGSVLNASEVNDNLMNQAVITFTNSTARASAITSPVEGMVTYLADTDIYQFWNGTAWTNLVSSTVGTGNAIINGAFEINQRNFTSVTTNNTFGFDRWAHQLGSSGGTSTMSAQKATLGSPIIPGQEESNFVRVVSASQSGANDYSGIVQRIEDVRSFAGESVTVSFYAKAATGTPKVGLTLEQSFGSGGSASTFTSNGAFTIGTSWARYSVTIAVPNLSGKTIGSGNFLGVYILNSTNTTLLGLGFADTGLQNGTFDYFGVQLEVGLTATAFRRNANSLQGELAACQRYYYRSTATANYSDLTSLGVANSTTVLAVPVALPVPMRVKPTSIDFSLLAATITGASATAISSVTINTDATGNVPTVLAVSSGLTQFRPMTISANNNSAGFIGFSAEL